MPHPLVTQLRFTRSEWIRGLKAVTAEEAARRVADQSDRLDGRAPAWQEQLYWLERAQGTTAVPEVKQFGYGKPLSVPPLAEAWGWWRAVTKAADPYLDTLTGPALTRRWKQRVVARDAGHEAAPHDLSLLVPPG